MSDDEFDIPELTQDDVDQAAAEFRVIDRDDSGTLDENELRQYLSSVRRAELRCFPKLIITYFGKDGVITFDQFLTFFKSLTAPPSDPNYLGRIIFDIIDEDHSGTIERAEFERLIDLIEAPRNNIYTVLGKVDGMNYEDFSKEFFRVLKMVWKSSGFR